MSLTGRRNPIGRSRESSLHIYLMQHAVSAHHSVNYHPRVLPLTRGAICTRPGFTPALIRNSLTRRIEADLAYRCAEGNSEEIRGC
jgi:hypothetical protein